MDERPLILVTNDDGIFSPGLAAAARAALRIGDAVIAAPNEQQTAMGRAYPAREDLGGINTGANCGTTVTSSGTIGAALESVDMGVPALAMSQEIRDYDARKPDFPGLDFGIAEGITEYWLRHILTYGMPKEADLLNVNVPEEMIAPDDYVFTFLETHPYYKAKPVPERDWSRPYRIQFDSDPLDSDAREGSDIHAIQFLRKTSVTPLTIDMTKRDTGICL